ncbi:MAG TPA: hypothetical protein VMI33_05255 [Streptosporangiaceae bacterium]|nr:hypothetical protein [Streptosporangiaceae bacterium]
MILLACTVGGSLAACSSGGSSTSSTPTPTPSSAAAAPSASSSSTSSAAAADAKTIAANWTAFFSPKTPVAQRISLLQDGQQFATVIRTQAAAGGLAAGATAKVTKVTVISPQQAAVTYTILLDGQPALSNQSGTAVYQDGTWKVGLASFCGLLSLENSGDTSKLPAACKSAA